MWRNKWQQSFCACSTAKWNELVWSIQSTCSHQTRHHNLSNYRGTTTFQVMVNVYRWAAWQKLIALLVQSLSSKIDILEAIILLCQVLSSIQSKVFEFCYWKNSALSFLPSILLILELCMSGKAWRIFLRSSLAHTMNAFIGRLIWGSLLPRPLDSR